MLKVEEQFWEHGNVFFFCIRRNRECTRGAWHGIYSALETETCSGQASVVVVGSRYRCLAGRGGQVLKVRVGSAIQLSFFAVLLHGAHDRVFPVGVGCIYLFRLRDVSLRGCSAERRERQREKHAVVFIVVWFAL